MASGAASGNPDPLRVGFRGLNGQTRALGHGMLHKSCKKKVRFLKTTQKPKFYRPMNKKVRGYCLSISPPRFGRSSGVVFGFLGLYGFWGLRGLRVSKVPIGEGRNNGPIFCRNAQGNLESRVFSNFKKARA